MRKLLLVLTLVFAMMLSIAALVSLTNAETQEAQRASDLRFNHVFVDQELSVSNEKLVQDVVAGVDLDNLGTFDLKDVKLTVAIPELGVQRSLGPFDVDSDSGTTRKVLLELFDDVPSGEYDVKLTLSNENFRKVRYRTVTLT
ncbi:hypothetical protein J4206_04600 [Candidatus Woesearchaeota archaeon]|nr:hypothetical protein [Candidatus Woesearchaeota archaeon]